MRTGSYYLGIILCTYNDENNIRRAIESCRKVALLFARSKILIIDDHSTDKTKEICLSYIEENSTLNIRLINKSKNRGISDSRNIGIRETVECDLITFIDGDDEIIEDGWIDFVTQPAQKITDITAFDFIKEERGVKTNIKTTSFNKRNLNEDEIYEAFINYLMRPNNDHLFTVIWSKIYKRSVVEGITFDTNMSNFEDLLFNLSLINRIKNCTIYSVPAYKYTINQPGTSLSNKLERTITSTLEMNAKAMKLIKVILKEYRPKTREKSKLDLYYHASYAYVSIIMSRETHTKSKDLKSLAKEGGRFRMFARSKRLSFYAQRYNRRIGGGPLIPLLLCRLGLYQLAVFFWYRHGLKPR